MKSYLTFPLLNARRHKDYQYLPRLYVNICEQDELEERKFQKIPA